MQTYTIHLTPALTPAQTEAIADADAHINNAGLPTYSELVEALQRMTIQHSQADLRADPDLHAAVTTSRALLARIPAR